MDNNFYENKPSRIRKEGKQPNVMLKVIVVQLVLSLVISGVLFAVCRRESELSNNIKNFYGEICKTDIAVSSLFTEFKNVVKQTFSPNVIEETTEDTKETGEE